MAAITKQKFEFPGSLKSKGGGAPPSALPVSLQPNPAPVAEGGVSDDEIVHALNYAVLLLVQLQDATLGKRLSDDTIQVYGRAKSTAIAQFSTVIARDGLDPLSAEGKLQEVFTPEELKDPEIALIRIGLILLFQSKLDGADPMKQHAALEELREIAERPDAAINQRALNLLKTVTDKM